MKAGKLEDTGRTVETERGQLPERLLRRWDRRAALAALPEMSELLLAAAGIFIIAVG